MKKCTGTDCNEDVSFLDETVFGVILAGLRDTNIQQKILSLAAMKTIQTLEELVTYVAAEESGYKEIANIGQNAGTVGGVKSTYTRNKGKCLNCGNSKHGDGSADDKAKHCPAYGKTCSRCDKKNHLQSVCRSKPKVAAVTKDRVAETPVNASLNFFGIKASSHDELALETAPQDIHLAPVITVPQLAALVSLHSRQQGKAPSTEILPHSVHSIAHGWLQTRPDNSPTHEV